MPRWTKVRLQEAIREHLRQLGRKGGKKRVERMTAEERSASARKAAKARWAKEKHRPR